MKAMSIWQPWATLIAIGAKKIETRGWPTRHRGTIAIHASKGGQTEVHRARIMELPEFRAALASGAAGEGGDLVARPQLELPLGAFVGVAELVACKPTEVIEEEGRLDEVRTGPRGSWCERALGDFTAGRHGWIFGRVLKLARPIPYRGERGIFEVPDILFEEQFAERRAAS